MRWGEWKPFYRHISKCLHIDSDADRRATWTLHGLLRAEEVHEATRILYKNLFGKNVIVCGAGPNLDAEIDLMIDRGLDDTLVVIAADGAYEALRKRGVNCHIVVTDLDGDRGGLRHAHMEETIVAVHAHGDNETRVREIVPQLDGVIGSTQVEPTRLVSLWGGFTDGDRACYMAAHYGARNIVLVGMDFGHVVGKWSKPTLRGNVLASPRKALKLRIGKWLLSILNARYGVRLAHIQDEFCCHCQDGSLRPKR